MQVMAGFARTTHRASRQVCGSIFFFANRPWPCRNFVPLYSRRSRREQYCLQSFHATVADAHAV